MRAAFNERGNLVVSSEDPRLMLSDFMEPTCVKCGEPIHWIVDMHSWVTMPDTSFGLVHAACAWHPEAFKRESVRAAHKEGQWAATAYSTAGSS